MKEEKEAMCVRHRESSRNPADETTCRTLRQEEIQDERHVLGGLEGLAAATKA